MTHKDGWIVFIDQWGRPEKYTITISVYLQFFYGRVFSPTTWLWMTGNHQDLVLSLDGAPVFAIEEILNVSDWSLNFVTHRAESCVVVCLGCSQCFYPVLMKLSTKIVFWFTESSSWTMTWMEMEIDDQVAWLETLHLDVSLITLPLGWLSREGMMEYLCRCFNHCCEHSVDNWLVLIEVTPFLFNVNSPVCHQWNDEDQ